MKKPESERETPSGRQRHTERQTNIDGYRRQRHVRHKQCEEQEASLSLPTCNYLSQNQFSPMPSQTLDLEPIPYLSPAAVAE